MERLFKKTAEFRAKATEEDYQALLDYFLKEKSAAWQDSECPYGFSRSSASNLLKERGLLDDKKEDDRDLDIKFCRLETKQHSIYVTDEVWERLNSIYKNYECIPKQNVLDAFLRKVLDDMGV